MACVNAAEDHCHLIIKPYNIQYNHESLQQFSFLVEIKPVCRHGVKKKIEYSEVIGNSRKLIPAYESCGNHEAEVENRHIYAKIELFIIQSLNSRKTAKHECNGNRRNNKSERIRTCRKFHIVDDSAVLSVGERIGNKVNDRLNRHRQNGNGGGSKHLPSSEKPSATKEKQRDRKQCRKMKRRKKAGNQDKQNTFPKIFFFVTRFQKERKRQKHCTNRNILTHAVKQPIKFRRAEKKKDTERERIRMPVKCQPYAQDAKCGDYEKINRVIIRYALDKISENFETDVLIVVEMRENVFDIFVVDTFKASDVSACIRHVSSHSDKENQRKRREYYKERIRTPDGFAERIGFSYRSAL